MSQFLYNLGIGKGFLNMIQNPEAIIKCFCVTKNTISQVRRQMTNWERIFANIEAVL